MHTRTTYLMAGTVYIAIVLLGLSAEIGVRLPLSSLGPEALAATLSADPLPFRLSILADVAMIAADIVLAGLLFLIFAPVDRVLAGFAALFRLIQAAILGANLLQSQAVLTWALAGEANLAGAALGLHATGYDLGLIFFGINSLLTAILLVRSKAFANWLGWLLASAGLVYLTGSTLRVLAPDLADAFAPAYLVAVIAETAFALTLLRLGFRQQRKARYATA